MQQQETETKKQIQFPFFIDRVIFFIKRQNQYKFLFDKNLMRPAYQYLSPNAHYTKRQNHPQEITRSPEFKAQLTHHTSAINLYSNHSNIPQQKHTFQQVKTKPTFLDKKVIQNQMKEPQNNQRCQVKGQLNDSAQFYGNQQLRTTCPNVFNKVQLASLRNTTHGNNLPKYTQTEEGRDGKRSDIIHHNTDMKKKGVQQLHNSYNPDQKKPSFVKNPVSSFKQAQMQFQKTCGPKTLNQIWKKNRELLNLRKQQTSTGFDESSLQSPQHDSSKIINGFYKMKELGVGKFGEVYLAKHLQTGSLVALKKIIKNKIKQYKMINQFKEQIRLHNSLDHPNIVKFFGFFQDGEDIYLVIQYIQGGTLFDALNDKDHLTTKQTASYIKCTLEAMTYMHDRSIAHRDIKPQNIVIASQGISKLCDFGWSALVQSSRKTYCGTFDYVPPEVLQQKNYDTSVDIWCLGVLTYELLTGRVPFEGEQKKQIMDKIISVDKKKINYPFEISKDAKDFIELIVQKDPKLRPRCKELLKHPFIVNNTQPPKK